MQKAVKKCTRAAVAVFSLASTMFLLGWRPALAQEPSSSSTALNRPISASKAPPVSTLMTAGAIGSPMAACQTRLERIGLTGASPKYSTTVAEQQACRIIEATLISKNGPNGGWCWLVTTDCGDQYQKGDCWYTESAASRESAR